MRHLFRNRFFRWCLYGLLLTPVACTSLRHRDAQRFNPTAPAGNELRVVTWNVGYFALSKNKNLRDVDIGDIVEVLKSTDAHVVILQEVSENRQGNELADRLGPAWTFHSVETGHQGQVLGLLTHLPELETVITEAGGRNMIGVSLRHPAGTDVFVTGVHAPHPARGMADTQASIRGAVDLLKSRSEPVRVFAGDLNYNFDESDQDSLYGEIGSVVTDSTLALGHTYYAGTRIDHAFHYPQDMEVNQAASGLIDLDARLAKVPGFRDHRPIVVAYALPAP